MAKFIEKLKALYAKLKKIKNIEIIIAVVFIALALILYSALTSPKKPAKENDVYDKQRDMIEEMESDLCRILSQISGAGRVEVMITYSGSVEKLIANTKSTHVNTTNNNGSITTSTSTVTETPILVSGDGSSKPYVLKEIMPTVTGVVVVSEGARDPRVRLEILRAVQTLLNISANNIEVFAMK
ncbi:MAG: hypothetical protein QM214_05720 [Bacillota bacterium]|jgi:stage III sporulation protein AG|nr:hypothetical protein [Bacillota bacterium]HHU42906.1 hypothetical protein [Clostridiales bacterium]